MKDRLQRSEMREQDEREESILSSSMMTLSVPETGCFPYFNPSIHIQNHQELADLLSSFKDYEWKETFSDSVSQRKLTTAYLERIGLDPVTFLKPEHGQWPPQKRTVLMKVKSCISRLATWLFGVLHLKR